MDWHEPVAGVGGGLIVAIVSWLLGRTDTAADRREKEIRIVAEQVYTEKEVDVRLNTIEVVLPRVEKKIDETSEIVKSTNDTLNRLLVSGRLHIRSDEP